MLTKTMLTGAAALAFFAGSALAGDQPKTGVVKSENTVQLATYRVSDGDQEVRIIIKDGVPEIYLNGKRVDPKQVETANGLWRIRGEDGQTKARFFMAPRDGGEFVLELDDKAADKRIVELKELLAQAPDAPPSGFVVQRRPVLGVTLDGVDEATAKQLKIDPSKSILVVGVAPGSGAAEAGIKANDIIVGIGDRAQGDLETIRAVLADKSAGDEVKVFVMRDGAKKPFGVRLKPLEGMEAPEGPEAILREFEEASRWGRGADQQDQERERSRVRGRVNVAPQPDLHERVLREQERSAAVRQRVQEMERRLRTEHEAQEQHQSELHRRMVIELDKQHELAQRLDGLRKMRVEIDAKTQREIEEAMARAAEALEEMEFDIELPEIEILGEGKDGNVLFLPSPPDAKAFGNVFRLRAPEAPNALHAPAAPSAPRFVQRMPGAHGEALMWQGAGAGGVDRLARIEERLAKIEGLLLGMAGGGKGGACNCDCCDD